jgi:hypothetical protein
MKKLFDHFHPHPDYTGLFEADFLGGSFGKVYQTRIPFVQPVIDF